MIPRLPTFRKRSPEWGRGSIADSFVYIVLKRFAQNEMGASLN